MIRLIFFFFNDTATTEIYTLSLHDALPISPHATVRRVLWSDAGAVRAAARDPPQPGPGSWSYGRPGRHTSLGRVGGQDRKSTRLNSSHANISYAVFCLKKKKKDYRPYI